MQDTNHKNEFLDQLPLAMAYVPWQRMTGIFENLEEAFCCGTIFPELNKPFTGRRCVKLTVEIARIVTVRTRTVWMSSRNAVSATSASSVLSWLS